MTSTFGWLDADAEQRRRMLELVDLFRDQGTVDEIGIGTVRDALSNTLFPGTSVLHTRLKYVLFVPWLMQRATHRQSAGEMAEEFRRLEYRLIDSLLAGGERQGVMGNTARANLKRLPSHAYWSALGAWGIREGDFTSDGFFLGHSNRTIMELLGTVQSNWNSQYSLNSAILSGGDIRFITAAYTVEGDTHANQNATSASGARAASVRNEAG